MSTVLLDCRPASTAAGECVLRRNPLNSELTGAYPWYILSETFVASGIVEKVRKVARWGNSLGFRIPQEGVEQLQLKEGESVNVCIKSDTITIRRAKLRKKWSEKELLKGVTPSIAGPDLVPDRRGRELL
jgi:antitoxin MazE